MTKKQGDFAVRSSKNTGSWKEMAYAGVLSFLRRRYTRDLNGVDVAVSGVPYDGAATNRSGSRFGPRAIRQASTELATLDSFPFGFNLYENLNIVDYGDCFVDPHHPETIINSIEKHAAEVILTGTKMLTFGGDHFVSYPLLKAHAKQYGPIALVQFDAHCDTWEDDGSTFDHGTMFSRAVNEGLIDTSKSTQIGLRTYNNKDYGFKVLTSPWVHKNGVDEVLDVIKSRSDTSPVYVSFDIDVLDPGFAPGTGTPVSGGLASWQVLEIIRGLGSLNLVGMDLVEVSPAYDHSEITALAAATIAHDWLCLLAQKNGAVPQKTTN
jgi:agmatinase